MRVAVTAILFAWILACGTSEGRDSDDDANVTDVTDVTVDATDTADAEGSGEIPAFHCALNETCPEILIEGDPHAMLGDAPAPFRGYGDPSLEYDPNTGILWLTYSWLDVLINGTPPNHDVDLGVRTHLAGSDDLGQTFTFRRAVNDTERVSHPDTGDEGWIIREVSTLSRFFNDTWAVLWFRYLDPYGPAERYDYFYELARGNEPDELGDVIEHSFSGWATDPSWGAADLSETVPELSDCAAFTEPALYFDDRDLWLATACLVITEGERDVAAERLVLLREDFGTWEYVGTLFDADDAAAFDADRLEQADISVGRDGSLILLVTPIVDGADPMHQGCIAFTIDDLRTASVARDDAGAPLPRHIITADGNGLGPGLCTYDAQSENGVLLVITSVDLESEPPDIVFSLRATGVHP